MPNSVIVKCLRISHPENKPAPFWHSSFNDVLYAPDAWPSI